MIIVWLPSVLFRPTAWVSTLSFANRGKTLDKLHAFVSCPHLPNRLGFHESAFYRKLIKNRTPKTAPIMDPVRVKFRFRLLRRRHNYACILLCPTELFI